MDYALVLWLLEKMSAGMWDALMDETSVDLSWGQPLDHWRERSMDYASVPCSLEMLLGFGSASELALPIEWLL